MPKLVLIRGLPGSGKTTLAKTFSCLHLEADMYFQREGSYRYDGTEIRKAHSWCKRAVRESLKAGIDVVVSNTFVKAWELRAYADIARATGAEIQLIETTEKFGNVHKIPDEVIARMEEQWEQVHVNNI